jgi:hypothetical protein
MGPDEDFHENRGQKISWRSVALNYPVSRFMDGVCSFSEVFMIVKLLGLEVTKLSNTRAKEYLVRRVSQCSIGKVLFSCILQ